MSGQLNGLQIEKKSLPRTVAVNFWAVLMLGACASTADLPQASMASCTTATCVLATITPGQWMAAEANPVVVNFEKVGSDGVVSDYAFTSTSWKNPKDQTLVFEAGKPYVLKFYNKFSKYNNTAGGDSEHYFTSPEFYRSIVIQKIVTPSATYKAPLLNDFELNAPAHNSNIDTEGAIYFVPVKTGIFTAVCKAGKHSDETKRAGMYATMQIAGKGLQNINFEVPADFPAALGDANHPFKSIDYASNDKDTRYWKSVVLKGSSNGIAASSVVLNIPGGPTSSKGSVMRFTKEGQDFGGVLLTSDFFKTMSLRKIHDKHAQIKPYFLESIEFAPGPSTTNPVNASKPGTGEVDLFMAPTVKGNYQFQLLRNASKVAIGSLQVS